MPMTALTGTRIRERRTLEGVKQADLARSVGISPAYLNLIEHNRRRIGGKLLVDIARVLNVDVVALSEGAQVPLIEGLQDAASDAATAALARGAVADDAETARAEEFAGRFPGWAGLVVRQRDRVAALERRVEALNDRLAHDPYLSDALHEVLSTVTAIRSTAGILNSGDDIDPEWQARFHRNLYEDSQRLADGAQSLVQYLDTIGNRDDSLSTPLDEFESWLTAQDFAVDLEAAAAPNTGAASARTIAPEAVSETAQQIAPEGAHLRSPAARELARIWHARAAEDAAHMPLALVDEVLRAVGPDPAQLAQRAGVDLPAAMRRLASLPPADHRPPVGLVICDAAGALTFRKPLDGFAPPRFGAACPLWPLYQSLLRPLAPIRQLVVQQGQPARRYLAYAMCQPKQPTGFDAPEVVEATMMFVPTDHVRTHQLAGDEEGILVGSSCRVCARADCPARREPSLVMDAST